MTWSQAVISKICLYGCQGLSGLVYLTVMHFMRAGYMNEAQKYIDKALSQIKN